jgi:hypothetical protein
MLGVFVGQHAENLCLCGLPIGKGAREELFSACRQRVGSDALVLRAGFGHQSAANQWREIARQGRAIHDHGFGQTREWDRRRLRDRDEEVELCRPDSDGRERGIVALCQRARRLAKRHAQAGLSNLRRGTSQMIIVHGI